jgi:geranylgeranylglycerol-phosphate geranylgeranyltransferase
LNAHIELLRLNVCILAILALLVGGLVVGIPSPVPFSFIAAGAVVFLICGGGNVINDYYDYETDKINKTNRPLPSGRISRSSVKVYAGLLLLFGNLIAIGFFPPIASVYTIFNTVIVWAYSWKLKRTAFGHIVDSYLAGSAFILAGLLFNNLNISILILAVIAFLGNFTREVVKGIEDLKGDSSSGMNTLEVLFGKKKSKLVVITTTLITVAISFIPYLYGANWLYLTIIFADVIFLYSLKFLSNPRKAQKLMKIGMFAAMAAFLIGSF